MPYYKVTKTYQYTETIYVEADSKREAEEMSGSETGYQNHDDTWFDSDAVEIDSDSFLEETQ